MTDRPLRRALRAPLNPAPEPAPALAPRTSRRDGSREVSTSTHQGRRTVSENARSSAQPSQTQPGAGQPAEVRVSHGRTINIGDFNSIRIDVSVTLPCTTDTVQDVIAEAHDHVVEAFIIEEEYLLGYASPTQPRRGNRRG